MHRCQVDLLQEHFYLSAVDLERNSLLFACNHQVNKNPYEGHLYVFWKQRKEHKRPKAAQLSTKTSKFSWK